MDWIATGEYDLHVPREQFLRLTFREAEALLDRHRQAERRADTRLACMMALMANIHRDTAKRPHPFTAHDFLDGARPAPADNSYTRTQTDAEQMQWLTDFSRAYMAARRVGGRNV